jgi:crossover junction endodeoxyribonuclease RuvC
MVLAGVDPGLLRTGYGVIEASEGDPTFIKGGVIQTDREEELPQRLKEIFEGLEEIFKTYIPSLLVLESPYSKHRIPKIAIIMAQVNGVVSLAAAKIGIPVVTYTANQIKYALAGSGRASKTEIQRVVQNLLNLPSIPRPPDVADALALALAHLRILGKV